MRPIDPHTIACVLLVQSHMLLLIVTYGVAHTVIIYGVAHTVIWCLTIKLSIYNLNSETCINCSGKKPYNYSNLITLHCGVNIPSVSVTLYTVVLYLISVHVSLLFTRAFAVHTSASWTNGLTLLGHLWN